MSAAIICTSAQRSNKPVMQVTAKRKDQWLRSVEPVTRLALSLPHFQAVARFGQRSANQLVPAWTASAKVHRGLPERGQIALATGLLEAISPPSGWVPDAEARAKLEHWRRLPRLLDRGVVERPANIRSCMGPYSQTPMDRVMQETLRQYVESFTIRTSYYGSHTSGPRAEQRWFIACMGAYHLAIFDETRPDLLCDAASVCLGLNYQPKELSDKIRKYKIEPASLDTDHMPNEQWVAYWEKLGVANPGK